MYPPLSCVVCSNSCPLSQWCYLTISSSATPFSYCLQSFPALGLFQWVDSFHQGPTHWSFRFSISPSNEYSVLISFRIDWFESPRDSQESSPTPQFKSINASSSAFFIVQLSHSYMSTRKTIVLTREIFVGKVMSLLFNKLPRLIITFLPRSGRLLISWLQYSININGIHTHTHMCPQLCPLGRLGRSNYPIDSGMYKVQILISKHHFLL